MSQVAAQKEMRGAFSEKGKELARAELEEKTERLQQFIETIASNYRNSYNLPMEGSGRIDMESYKGLYADVDKDKNLVREKEQAWFPDATGEEIKGRTHSDGERLEMLTFAVLHKNLGQKFVLARASRYDDIINGADTILLDKKTGNLVCAFDEVGDASGAEYEKKQATVKERNVRKGGATLKYGLKLTKENDTQQVSPAEVKNLPVFYIALPKEFIEKVLREFSFSLDEQSDSERKLFDYFIAAVTLQTQALELYGDRLNEGLKKKLSGFKKTLENIKSERVKGGL